MPGPTLCLPAPAPEDDSDSDPAEFGSCEEVQRTRGEPNGAFSSESLYHECSGQLPAADRRRRRRAKAGNGVAEGPTKGGTTPAEGEGEEGGALGGRALEAAPLCGREDADAEDGAPEAGGVPAAEARQDADADADALTRRKIASLRNGRTLSYADGGEPEEPPTRPSPRRPLLWREGPGLGAEDGPRDGRGPEEGDSPSPAVRRATRVCRNPSFQTAVKDATVLSPKRPARAESSGALRPAPGSGGGRPSEGGEADVDAPLASGIARSVSFSGPEAPPPSAPASGSLSEGNSRCGSASQLSSPSSKQPVADKTTTSPPPPPPSSIARGSSLSRSFRRLFSNPACTTPTGPPDAPWQDSPELQPPAPGGSEAKASSRLRKISHSFSRRLSTRSKMDPQGPQVSASNGTAAVHEDSRSLVDYEDLLKLFCCPGCQLFMAPPLYQCRKGHLVCGTCRYSLKQTCPTCKQRFADNTNMMMEQVCQLVKFPCRWVAEGCQEYHQPRAKQDHEQFCMFRPLPCHNAQKGCAKVLILRDMRQHLQECEFGN